MATKKLSAAPFAFVGILVAVLIPIAFSVAIFSDSYWTFNVNSLSDLGISYDAFTANLFNYTCMIGGALLIIFGLGKMYLKTGLDSASAFFVALSGALLIGIGILNKSYSIHEWIAYIFFLSTAIAMIVSMVSDSMKGRKFTTAISVIAVTVTIICIPGFTIYGVEVIFVMAVFLWLAGQGLSLAFSKA